ncbi:MAG: helix-turn-helix transcriptional regulator [Lentisphaerae bacterium]|jgi:AraC-like DNA-binding protein|nr:helix-turn-helix transcriptional regulator [Lentisphaerota bacterium]
MTKYQISLEALLPFCEEGLAIAHPTRLTVHEEPEEGWVHSVPRLLILLEGEGHYQIQKNGKLQELQINAPAILYCAKDGKLTTPNNPSMQPLRSLSFSFYPNYIRAMHIDCDGVHIPPTERDIFYHTDQPLSDAGIALLKAIDCLLEADNQPLAEELLFPLFQITVEDLKVSDASPSERYLRPMRRWNQINAFLREHREESITRSQVARLFRISPGYVSELCRQNTGESFSQVKLHYQLERAENLLIHSGMNVNEIAAQCGFSSANYFIRRFRKAYGVTPHVYRNQQTKQPQ